MKKNDLIELLNCIKGNPEITIYNGYVEEVVPIEKISIETKTRLKKDKQIELSIQQNNTPNNLNREWYLVNGLENKKEYEFKHIITIHPKSLHKIKGFGPTKIEY